MPGSPPAGTPAPMPVITPRLSVEASGATLDLPTDKPVMVVGREDPISGIYPEVDLTPHGGESGGVSRQHARLLHDGDSWKVEDLNSTNYTKVNGTKIAPNTPTALNDGDKVNFGRVALTFHKG
jgi:pSer/pThr/pTyr-binding forkhead associated (FHA) protein